MTFDPFQDFFGAFTLMIKPRNRVMQNINCIFYIRFSFKKRNWDVS